MNCNELTDLFMARTGEDSEVAQKYLEMNYWSLSSALTFYRVDRNEGKI